MYLVRRNWMTSSLCSEKDLAPKNGKTGASEGKQSAQIKSRLITLSQWYSGLKADYEENHN